MFRSFCRSASLAVTVLAMTGCGDDPVNLPTTPTPTPTTEIFTGTLTVNGAATHQFAAGNAGSVTATLSNIGPDDSTVTGLTLGEWTGASCVERINNDAAVRTTQLLGSATQPGLFCVRIRDVGRLSGPVDYEITVVHP